MLYLDTSVLVKICSGIAFVASGLPLLADAENRRRIATVRA